MEMHVLTFKRIRVVMITGCRAEICVGPLSVVFFELISGSVKIKMHDWCLPIQLGPTMVNQGYFDRHLYQSSKLMNSKLVFAL